MKTLQTLHSFRQGGSEDEIALVRGLMDGTIYGRLKGAVCAGEEIDLDRLLDARAQRADAQTALTGS